MSAAAGERPNALAVLRLLAPPRRYGAIADLARSSGLRYGYLSSLAWVADRVPAEVVPVGVKVAHLFAVATLDVADQRRRLAEAVAQDLSGAELRRRIAAEVEA
jgi:hypothetical protein